MDPHNSSLILHPFSLKDAPAMIERLLPVQKLSAEAYKEQMAVHGKTLTALGSYWKVNIRSAHLRGKRVRDTGGKIAYNLRHGRHPSSQRYRWAASTACMPR
jgi:hypothetical protein